MNLKETRNLFVAWLISKQMISKRICFTCHRSFPLLFFITNADSDLDDLNLLVHALRDLLEGYDNLKKCKGMIEKFCQNMASNYPEGKFQCFNFNALRHSTWQVKKFGSLSATSASMFESANHFLTRTFTGNKNYCSIMVTRYIHTLLLKKSDIDADSPMSFTDTFLGCCSTKFTVDCGLKQNSDSQEVLENHPTCRIYCRDRSYLTLDTKAYGRGGHDSFVALNESESRSLVIGRILLFFENGDENFIYLQLFYKHKVFFPTDEECLAFGYEVAPTDRKKVFRLHSIEHKLIGFDFKSTLHLLTQNKHFEHD